MTSRSVSRTFATTVPTIDISRSDVKQVAREIGSACENIGFLTITGHGIPREVQHAMMQATRDFFDLSVSLKRVVSMTPEYPYGYSGYEEENLASGYGQQGKPDLKETFTIGPYNPAAGMPAIRWPDIGPPHLQPALLQYYQHMEKLSERMLQLFAVALDLQPNWFADKVDRHRSALRCLNYPPQSKQPDPGQVRAGAHTDYGSLTILLQDGTGGLQVLDKQGQWVDVPPVPESYVINIGDLMSRWTNDKWVSTLHRVVNPPSDRVITNKRRQSAAFFHNINHDYLVSCIPTCVTAEQPCKYAPITAWDHLMEKHLTSVQQKKK